MAQGNLCKFKIFGEAAIRAVSESAFSEGKRELSEQLARIGETKLQSIVVD